MRQILGSRVKQLRDLQGLTQEELAARAGLYWTQIQRIEQGKLNVTLNTLEHVAAGLGVPISHLFLEENQFQMPELGALLSLLQTLTQKELRIILEVTHAVIRNQADGK